MNIRRLLLTKKRELVLYTKRFYPAGNYTWLVPEDVLKQMYFLLEVVEVEQVTIQLEEVEVEVVILKLSNLPQMDGEMEKQFL